MKQNILLNYLLVGVVSSVGAFAEMTVDKSNGMLTVTSDKSGKVSVKVIGPDDEMVVNEKYEGNSFSWIPSGVDGTYRYDVRIAGEHTGGSVRVKNGNISTGRKK